MTYRLSLLNGPTVAPRQEESVGGLLRPSRLLSAAEILEDRTLLPDQGGIYGWWFDAELAGISTEGAAAIGRHHLLYVGIAPRRPSANGRISKRNLRTRILRDHLGNRIGSSTLRRTLAHLLRHELQLTIEKQDRKQVMRKADEAALTRWIIDHAALSFLFHPTPWEVEAGLVQGQSPRLPLNIAGSPSPSANLLLRLRAEALSPGWR